MAVLASGAFFAVTQGVSATETSSEAPAHHEATTVEHGGVEAHHPSHSDADATHHEEKVEHKKKKKKAHADHEAHKATQTAREAAKKNS